MDRYTDRVENPPYDLFQDSAEDLLTSGDADPLDTGYSPPEQMPPAARRILAAGSAPETLDDRLGEEEPEVWDTDQEGWDSRRAGRIQLPADDDGVAQDLYALDDGVDGGGASAEEAAVHLMDANLTD
jgi:hypothetical protein